MNERKKMNEKKKERKRNKIITGIVSNGQTNVSIFSPRLKKQKNKNEN